MEFTLAEFTTFSGLSVKEARAKFEEITGTKRITKTLTIPEDVLRNACPRLDFDFLFACWRTLWHSPERLAVVMKDPENIKKIEITGKYKFLNELLPEHIIEERVLPALANKHAFHYCGKELTREFIAYRKRKESLTINN